MRTRDEDGAVLVIVAIAMPLLLLLVAGGFVTFTLSGVHGELRRAADQAALAGAAAIPAVDPSSIVDGFAPDPRAAACDVASANLVAESARLVDAFQTRPAACDAALEHDVTDCDVPFVSLDGVLPFAFTPRMRVEIRTNVAPPMLSLLGFGSSGAGADAVARRRIKNAVVVPIVPAARLRIQLGQVTAVEVMTDPVNVNRALREYQPALIDAVDDVDARLDPLGLPCSQLLDGVRADLRDLYAPPSGSAPTALDIVEAGLGEDFLLIGVTVDDLMRPIAATQIPILDAALVVMDEVSEGDYRASVVAATSARGAFRAVLIR